MNSVRAWGRIRSANGIPESAIAEGVVPEDVVLKRSMIDSIPGVNFSTVVFLPIHPGSNITVACLS